MNDFQSLSHTTWDCKYDLVWIPKYRRKVLYGHLRKYLGDVLRELALQKESRVVEGHLIEDHVHMLIALDNPLIIKFIQKQLFLLCKSTELRWRG